MDLHLDTDAPRDPDYTRQVARGLEACMRVLNNHTRDSAALPDPDAVYDVLGSLHAAAAGFDQLLRQLNRRLADLHQAGRVGADHGDPDAAVRDTAKDLRGAVHAAETLAGWLGNARNTTAFLYLRDGGEQ